jgi:hypothetical protein
VREPEPLSLELEHARLDSDGETFAVAGTALDK